jgi:hypothetical protein
MFRNLFDFGSYAKPKFELRQGALQLTNVPVPEPNRMLDREFYRSKLYDVGVMMFEGMRYKLGWNYTRAQALTRAILDQLVTTIRRHQAVPVFAYLPVLTELANTRPEMTPNEQFLRDFCEEQRVDCVFLRDRFIAAQQRGEIFNIRTHYSANAHRTAAEGIVTWKTRVCLPHTYDSSSLFVRARGRDVSKRDNVADYQSYTANALQFRGGCTWARAGVSGEAIASARTDRRTRVRQARSRRGMLT